MIKLNRVKINAYKVGVVMNNGKVINFLKEGKYWFNFSDKVLEYNLNQEITANYFLDILLDYQVVAEAINVYTIKDNEIALLYRNGIFETVLSKGRYAYWELNKNIEVKIFTFEGLEADKDFVAIAKNNAQLLKYINYADVKEYEDALLFVDEKFVKVLSTGVYYFWNAKQTVKVIKSDLRQIQMEISGQEILTKDKAAIRLNFYANYKVESTTKALLENKDFEKQLYVFAQLALREFVGTLSLDELLANKESISTYVLSSVAEKAKNLGVSFTNAGVRDIILSGEMKEIMNRVLVAEKQAQANTIMRREETASTRSLLNTAKLMEDNEMLWKLKEMEYVEKIAEKIGEITVAGSGDMVGQLKQIFTASK